MEEKQNNTTESIKKQLGGDSTKKKLVIKKKSSSSTTTTSSSSSFSSSSGSSGSNTSSQNKLDGLFVPEKLAQAKSVETASPKETKESTENKTQGETTRLPIMEERDVIVTPKKVEQKPQQTNKESIHSKGNQQSSQHSSQQQQQNRPSNQQQGSKPINLMAQKNVDKNPIIARPTKTVGDESRPNQSQSTLHKKLTGGGSGGGQYSDNKNSQKKGNFSKPSQGGGTGKPSGGGYKGGTGGGSQSKSNSVGTTTPAFGTETGIQRSKRSSFNSGIQDKKEKTEERGSGENSKFFKQILIKKNPSVSGTTVPKEISIMENIQVGELAKKLNLKPNDVITKLMKMGMMVTINNVIDSDTATLLADEYGCKVKIVSLYEETVIQEAPDNPDHYVLRPPVVTIMGHVDHGKTKLLDTIRASAVIDTEAGGITQHIGAYQVKTNRGAVTFLDTPGHEAFTSMRARGASVTDIVVLVVAADDGVMPQTLEAISHAKDAEVPIIVAINKIDLPTANPDRVMQELANHGLQAEEWGGTTIFCKISAKNKVGIDKLLEMIAIQSEILELKANPHRSAKGRIIEAKLDPGRGPVATVLIQNGTLRVGDPFLAGVHSGKVRAMFDDFGHNIYEALPSTPVLVTGLDAVPEAGDPFDVIKDEKEARQISQHRKEFLRIGQAKNSLRVTLDNMNEIIQQGTLKELKIIIKSDVRGSAEAIKEALEKLTTQDVKLTVIYAGTGAIIDSDVMLASASNAIIVGFHVRANPRTLAIAEKENVEIRYYSIIYDVVSDIKSAMEGLLEPERIENVVGKLEVRDVFKISKIGNIAGCMVTEGKINKNFHVRLIRENIVLFDGKIRSLKRLKDDVTEVLTGFECGVLLDGYNDVTVGDELEVYEVQVIKRKLK
jgi:translation initiation factor IF-2